jgi:hypothetical protein
MAEGHVRVAWGEHALSAQEAFFLAAVAGPQRLSGVQLLLLKFFAAVLLVFAAVLFGTGTQELRACNFVELCGMYGRLPVIPSGGISAFARHPHGTAVCPPAPASSHEDHRRLSALADSQACENH